MLDNTAKLYSRFKGKRYNDVFAEVDVYHEEDFFLSCYSYRLMIPVKSRSKGALNIFELTLLRMYNLHFWTNEDLADKTGMDLDFVNFIVLSLIERGYLTDERKLTDRGKEEISQGLSEEGGKVEYVTARIFALKKNGALLPVICLDEQDIKLGEVEREKRKIKVTTGDSAGKEKVINYHYYNSGKTDKNRPNPTRAQIFKLLQDYNRLVRNSNEDIIKLKGNDLNVERAEDVFVHLKAVIQRNDIRVNIISDGLVGNDSTVVEYFEQEKDLGFFDKLYERANRVRENEGKVENKLTSKYPQIESFLKKNPEKGSTYEERNSADRTNSMVVRNLFAAVEWALHFYLKQHPLKDTVQSVLLQQSGNENKELALRAVKRIGFDTKTLPGDKSDKLFSQAYGYKLTQYFTSPKVTPNLDVLLPLCMIQAGNDSSSSWHEVVKVFPNLFGVLKASDQLYSESSEGQAKPIAEKLTEATEDLTSEARQALQEEEQQRKEEEEERKKIENVKFNLFLLREYAKQRRHHEESVHTSYIIAKGWYDQVVKLICLLLPDYVKGTAEQGTADDQTLRLIADINSLNKWFSPLGLKKFSSSLYREILSISPNRDTDDFFSPIELILSLSKILEYYFKERVYLLDIPASARKDKKKALEYIKQRLEGLSTPPYLETINPNFYNFALDGSVATLGAYALVWAGHNDEDVYTGARLLEVLELVGKVTELRMHGNNVFVNRNKEDLLKLRDNVLDMISRMEE